MTKVFIEGAPEKLYTVEELVTQKVSEDGWRLKQQEKGQPRLVDSNGNKRSLISVEEEAFGDDEDRVVYTDSSTDEIYDALEECLESIIGADDRRWLDVVFEVDGKESGHYQVLDVHHNLTRLDDSKSVRATEAVEEWNLEIQEREETGTGEYCTATYDSQDAREHAFVVDDLLAQVYDRDLTDIVRLRLRPEGKVYVLE
jgi:hypothetical protein